MTVVEEFAKNVIKELLTKKEKLILECVNKRLGTNWSLEDLASNVQMLKDLAARMHIIHMPNKDQVYMLDEKDLLLIRDVPLKIENTADKINVSFQYMELEP